MKFSLNSDCAVRMDPTYASFTVVSSMNIGSLVDTWRVVIHTIYDPSIYWCHNHINIGQIICMVIG